MCTIFADVDFELVVTDILIMILLRLVDIKVALWRHHNFSSTEKNAASPRRIRIAFEKETTSGRFDLYEDFMNNASV